MPRDAPKYKLGTEQAYRWAKDRSPLASHISEMQNPGLFRFLTKSAPLFFAALVVLPYCSTAKPRSVALAQQDTSRPSTPRGKKLIMKDGSFQIVSSYALDGDRVRYFSVERAEWEELPASLIDWPATKKAETDQEKTDAALTTKLKVDEEAARAPVDVDASFEVVPGVFLPPGEGFFILDNHAVFSLKQSPASAKLAKGHFLEQIAVPLPVIPSRTSVDLPGKHAAFRTTNPTPEFYFRTTDLAQPEIELVAAHVQSNKRHIENIDRLFGQQSFKGKSVPIQEWQIATGLYRFTLGESLTPGEYAFVQFSPKEGLNLLLWDFGVDRPRANAARKK